MPVFLRLNLKVYVDPSRSMPKFTSSGITSNPCSLEAAAMEEEVKTLRRTGSSIVVYCTGERYIAGSDTSLGGNFLPIVFPHFDIGICCRRSLYNLSMCSLGGHF